MGKHLACGGAFIPPFGGSLTREREGRGRNFSFTVLRLFFWLQKKRGKLRPTDGSTEEKSVHGAVAPSPPSEEGGGCLHKGFEQADGGRDTPSMCESSSYSRQQRQITAFSFGARLHLRANSDLALSLPQSRCFNPFSPRQLPPQREPRRLPPRATDSVHRGAEKRSHPCLPSASFSTAAKNPSAKP